jgi:hypothetical protein
MDAMRARLWTAMPGFVNSFNPTKMTVEVRPALKGRLKAIDGTTSDVTIPPLLDCPVLFMGGGNCITTYPIAPNDECLVIFASRSIDNWWASGAVSSQTDSRMHNLSDGFALVGVRSLPNAITVDMTVAQLRSIDGSTSVSLDPEGQLVKLVAPGGITLNNVTIDSAGNISTPHNIMAAGTITGETDVVAAGISGKSHVHGGVQSGMADTTVPI